MDRVLADRYESITTVSEADDVAVVDAWRAALGTCVTFDFDSAPSAELIFSEAMALVMLGVNPTVWPGCG